MAFASVGERVSLELDDIQAWVLRAHHELPWASYLFLRIDDPAGARVRLGAALGELTCAKVVVGRREERPRERAQLAVSAGGLLRLGVDQTTLATFAPEFQSGMAEPARSGRLGDRGPSDPSGWELGGAEHRLDLLLCLFAPEAHERDRLVERWVSRLVPALAVEKREDTIPRRDDREHFGFRDGLSQPILLGDPGRGHVPDRDLIAAGEFLLGYPNEYDKLPPSPHLPDGRDLGKNGTYLVFRKLEQDVAGFWRTFNEAAQALGGELSAEALAAKCMGRWPSGAPLALSPDRDDHRLGKDGSRNNDFLYLKEDALGTRCPIASHLRRANPRDAKGGSAEDSLKLVRRRRLIRRGRLYGPAPADPRPTEPDGIRRGLYFVALNANLSRQFELVQQTWLSNPKFAGLTDDRDPVGAQVAELGSVSLPAAPFRYRLSGLPSFVTVRGGEYFFLPGLRALGRLLGRGG